MAPRPPTEPAVSTSLAKAPTHGALWRIGDILRRLSLAVLGTFLFILGIQLMRSVAAGVGPVLIPWLGPLTERPLHALSFGWLLAYAIMSGSPVAAFSLGLLDARLINVESTYLMIMGSRLGASFIVLVIGLVALARGQPREKCLAMGVLSFLVTYSVYLPAIAFGWVLLKLGALDWFSIGTPEIILDYIDRIFGPILLRISEFRLPAILVFLFALVAIYAGLALFDKAFGRREEQELKSPRMHRYLQHPAVAFLVGALITLASTSVSLSLGLLVPLYLHGYIDRRKIVPYMMGANITTFIDTLVAAIVMGGGVYANIVLLEMGSVTLFSILALATYRRYSRAIDAAYTAVFHSNWALGGFVVLLFAAPLALLFYF